MPRGEKAPKLTPEQRRNLIEEYDISFDGPIAPSTWPAQYVDVFRKIHDIDRMRFDEYQSNEKRDLLTVNERKRRASRLIRIAYDCRKYRANESTWRLDTEPEVVFRFGAEVVCLKCRNRLWISDFQALPDEQGDAERLRQRRARRTICQCDANSRAAEDLNDFGEAQLFSNQAEHFVLHDPADKLAERGELPRRPDRVYGLGMTNSLKRLTSARPNVRHSPFLNGKVLYPFLVIEAKSEKGGPGFEFIETQTAFPIRTMLKLQFDLHRLSGVDLNPLVWFMAYQGDEWRVYAGIHDESKFRIIDLWHGTILSQNGALQLLQIIDYICDWARDIYRFNILRCLAGGEINLRELTPAWTIISSKLDQPDAGSSSSTPPALSNHEISSLIDLTQDDVLMQDIVPASQRPEPFESMNLTGPHPLLRFSGANHNPRHWTKKATIRHSNLILFSFRHIALPEERGALEEILSQFQPTMDIRRAARYLLRFLTESETTITITLKGLSLVEELWTQADAQVIVDSDEQNQVRAWIHFQTYYRSGDWQILRQLSCITCAARAAVELGSIAGTTSAVLRPLTSWIAHRCPCLVRSAQVVQSMCGKDSAAAAMHELALNVHLFDDGISEAHFRWTTSESNTLHNMLLEMVSNSSSPYVHDSSTMLEVFPSKPAPPYLNLLIRAPKRMGTPGAILLQKSSSWPASCPTFCLLVLGESDFDDEPKLGSMICRAIEAREVYAVYRGREGLADNYQTDLRLWVDILCGNSPVDAPWQQ